ncbi:hypothetical protein K431DRAFT_277622 [Polychaeton citri CBS 116435]|uniref:Ribosome quality control complex subunit 2 n=1 Tax=Polychaeton citri CBS 116435 TaxID=1314669 RepID=A0A9P4Q0E7_9PEZI|nr:hypothetical protein K431DRAFT_277622 [Polychaeton citri CBS 116435]
MKQRFSSLDVKIIAHELSNSLVTLRLANVYDLSTRIFLLKFAKPDHREQLLIDSGFRCHLTAFSRATAAAPSPFVARLRKFLRTRRVTSVRQIGTDRVIEIQFSDGQYRLFLEFYAGGNVILTDADLSILALLRTVNEGAEHEQYRQGLKYDLSLRQNFSGVPELTKQRIREGLQKVVDKQAEAAGKPGKKVKKKAGDALRKALAVTTTEFPPVLIDHALEVTGTDRNLQPADVISNDDLLDSVLTSLQAAQKIIAEITSAEVAKGYILAKRRQPRANTSASEEGSTPGLVYDDFHPFKPSHLSTESDYEVIEYDGFNKAVDDFFSSIEGQKLESKLQEREDTAKRRIEAAHEEQAKRIGALQTLQELNVRKAQAIQANVERVEEATAAVNGLIQQGMDWVDMGKLIENEQARHNPVAQSIKLPLKLEENTITLLLSEFADEPEEEMADETDSEASDSDDDAQEKPTRTQDTRLAIDVDLSLSGWANARQYFDQKRTAANKEERTTHASQKALKSTEKKVMADLKKGLKQEKDVLRPVRKQLWFEKFIYFISSDGYLVLAGRDAQQNEMLYRRYLKRGDIYVHADLHGAASVIIKNNPATPDAPIPPSTLSQAGNLAVCTSSAWDSKAGMSAWWVNSDQVSKTAPTGEYLTTGGFMVRGKKNFLPPAQLILGFAIMFQISEESKARHVRHRLKIANSSVPPTPDLTDAETIPESSVANGDVGDESDDDDFDDAGPAPAAQQQDYDEPPYANTQQAADEEDDFSDAGNAQADAREDEDHARAPAINPLQTNSGGKSTGASLARSARRHPASDADTASQSTLKAEKQRQVRGKRGKAKKAAQKYKDQDEEDRAMAMKLLGSRAAEEKREADAATRALQKETAEEARARRRAQHQKAQREGLEAEEIRRLNLEEGVEALDEEESSSLTQLDAFVGTPLPGDEILEAIPICAPWDALRKAKYKVKMQPGQQKKGKAVREILGKWTKDGSDNKKVDPKSEDTERIWPREAELIKAWREAEVMGVIPVKSMRVMMSGGTTGADKKGGKGGKSARGGKGGKRR